MARLPAVLGGTRRSRKDRARGRPTHLGQAATCLSRQRSGMQPSTPATILVVEESAAVRELIEHALRECGHAVLSTKDAFEAFEVARRIRVDLLVLGALGGGRVPTLVRDLRSEERRVGNECRCRGGGCPG